MRRLDRHIPLSALWLFVLLNIIFRDTRQFVLASRIEMQLTDQYNWYQDHRRADAFGRFPGPSADCDGALFAPGNSQDRSPCHLSCSDHRDGYAPFPSPATDMDDTFHPAIEIAALMAVLWAVWMWPEHEHTAPQSDAISF